MIKENKDFFLYVLGTIVCIILTVGVIDFILGWNMFGKDCGILGYECWFENIGKGKKVYDSPFIVTCSPCPLVPPIPPAKAD